MELLYGTVGGSDPDRLWSLANFGELITAPVTPLCWSVWHQGLETGSRQAYADFGVLRAADVPAPADPNRLLGACFAGRIALNIDLVRGLMNAIPGASGDGFERDIVGRVRPGLPPDKLDLGRLPALAVKAPVLFARAARTTRAGHDEMAAWWRHSVLAGPPAPDLAGAVQRFAEALDRVRRAARCQAGSRFVVMAVQTQLVALCETVGVPANEVLAGIGDTPEARLADELWLAGQGRRGPDELLASHGYYGVHIGNMTGRSWRQDPALLHARIAAAALGHVRPADREAATRAGRDAAVKRLREALPLVKRPLAARLAAASATQFRALEYGKAAVMMAVDGCRAAAAEVGEHLVAAGTLDDPDDVVFLRHDELGATDRATARVDTKVEVKERVAERRAVWAEFAGVTLPTHFVGEPVAVSPVTTERVDRITGAAGSAGVVEGRVRLVHDASGDIEPGEVLVCPFTDPSWTPLMALAAAVVVDVGGPASHGAVVARELGIPCVIGTETAMHALRDGDTVRVDGTNGVVEVRKP
jgi:pyruvate,water dikinase